MALKELAATSASVNEDAIEAIISDHIRYDLDDERIILTPAGSKQSNRRKILSYLVANEGWIYLDKKDYRVKTAPKDLEEPLGIKGGSLRPVLRSLESENLVKKTGSEYRIVPANLFKICDEFSDQ